MIWFDKDGALQDVVTPYIEYHGLRLDYEDITDWGMTATGHSQQEINRTFSDYRFWEKVEFYPGIPELLRFLKRCDVDFGIATAACDNPAAMRFSADTAMALGCPLLASTKKYEHIKPGDVLIDDKPENVSEALDRGVFGLLLSQPWNEGFKCDHRCHTIIAATKFALFHTGRYGVIDSLEEFLKRGEEV